MRFLFRHFINLQFLFPLMILPNVASAEFTTTDCNRAVPSERVGCASAFTHCDGITGENAEGLIVTCKNAVMAHYLRAPTSPAEKNANVGTAQELAEEDQCRADTAQAQLCCGDPIKCVTDMDSGTGESIGIVTNVVMGAGMALTAGSGSQEGMKKWCDIMNYAGNGTGAINTAFAVKCTNSVDDCVKSCTESKAAAAGNPSLQAAYSKSLATCRAQKQMAAQMGQNAAAAIFSAQMGRLCSKAADANINLKNPPTIDPPPALDCSKDPTNPSCQNPYATKPEGTDSGLNNSASAFNSRGSNDFNTLGDGDPGQAPVTGGGAGIDAKANSVPNGGGGMLGGGGMPGGGAGANKAARGAGHDTDIMKGERGGGGYSAQGGGISPGGGWSGYGGGAPEKTRTGLDLSKYLPGEKDKANRGPAGLGRATADVAPITADIFQKISDRVQIICKTKRLECN